MANQEYSLVVAQFLHVPVSLHIPLIWHRYMLHKKGLLVLLSIKLQGTNHMYQTLNNIQLSIQRSKLDECMYITSCTLDWFFS